MYIIMSRPTHTPAFSADGLFTLQYNDDIDVDLV